MNEPKPLTPAWVQLLKPQTAAQAEAARRYVEHLRSVYRIERRDDLAPPYRATRPLLNTDEIIVWNRNLSQLMVLNEEAV